METQQSIGAWRRKTFGPFRDIVTAFDRADQEWWELVDAVAENHGVPAIGAEMADVIIVLMGWAEELGINLQDEIDKKMAINRARRWASNGDGTGQHIEED